MNKSIHNIRVSKDAKIFAEKETTDKGVNGLSVGDKINFMAGYYKHINYTKTIIGFGKENPNEIYLDWDCYWSPIRANDSSRSIKRVPANN